MVYSTWGEGCDAGLRKEEADGPKRGVGRCCGDLELSFPDDVLSTIL